MSALFQKGDTVITPSGRQATIMKYKFASKHGKEEATIIDDETGEFATLHPAYLQLLVGRKSDELPDRSIFPVRIFKKHGKPPPLPTLLEIMLPMVNNWKTRINGASKHVDTKLDIYEENH